MEEWWVQQMRGCSRLNKLGKQAGEEAVRLLLKREGQTTVGIKGGRADRKTARHREVPLGKVVVTLKAWKRPVAKCQRKIGM